MENPYPLFGVKWPMPGKTEMYSVLIAILLIIIIYFVYKYIRMREEKRIRLHQRFLLNAKTRGLSRSQISIIEKISRFARLKNINELLYDMPLFESSLGKFIDESSRATESGENLQTLRDIMIICQRLYLSDTFKAALKSMRDILVGELFCLESGGKDYFLGKIRDFSGENASAVFFSEKDPGASLRAGTPVTLYFSRLFDGEYMIHTEIAAVSPKSVDFIYSDDMVKIREFRLPFVDINIPVEISALESAPAEKAVSIQGNMTRVNENEAYIQVEMALEIGKDYEIVFELNEFRFNIKSVLLSARFSKITRYHDLLFKFSDLTGAGKTVLVKYITEKLSR